GDWWWALPECDLCGRFLCAVAGGESDSGGFFLCFWLYRGGGSGLVAVKASFISTCTGAADGCDDAGWSWNIAHTFYQFIFCGYDCADLESAVSGKFWRAVVGSLAE